MRNPNSVNDLGKKIRIVLDKFYDNYIIIPYTGIGYMKDRKWLKKN
jgi:hypothetical protein